MISDRIVYASFPACLKAAMKLAAQRNGWTRADWAMQTQMLADSMARGCYSAEELADAYRLPPTPPLWRDAA